ncbi:MAG: hypothetical protein K6G52_07325 [Treponemataceae bacterium]|nr:hypothetical protein [Treponemataceae bacterium]
MKKLRRIFVVLVLLSLSASVFALPGIKEAFQTESGQYVYYRDYRLENPLYIGFLYYGEDTIQVRYLLKADGKNLVQDKSFSIFFSLDEKADHIELTGEKLPDGVTNDDSEIINYIHSVLYEFASMRKHSNDEDFSEIFTKTHDVQYFGGPIQVTYDKQIPLFNIEAVDSIIGEKVFKAVTMGSINDNADLSFEKFPGFVDFPSQPKTKKLSEKKLAAFVWEDSDQVPNLKTLGDNAVLWNLEMDIPESEITKRGVSVEEYFSRANQMSLNGSYAYLPEAKCFKKGSSLICCYPLYSPSENDPFRYVVKVFEKTESAYALSIISTYYKFYWENKQYFDTLY